jgi:hypothetical protein
MKPSDFRLTSGKEHVSEYGFSPESKNHHVFCRHCGIRLYTHGFVAEIGGAYVSVALATLDDLTPEELAAAPTTFMNGRDDDWFNQPKFTAHL